MPSSLLVVGGGATGAQLASVFNAFGASVQLFEAGARVLQSEDEDVSAAVAESLRAAGERAVEIAQAAAIAMTAKMRVEDVARVPFSFPAYTGVLGRAAAVATRQLSLEVGWQGTGVEGT